MCHVVVDEDNFKFEISEWDDFTVSLLRLYADSKRKADGDGVGVGVVDVLSRGGLPVYVREFIHERALAGDGNGVIREQVSDRFGFDVHESTISRYANRPRKGNGDGKKKRGRKKKMVVEE